MTTLEAHAHAEIPFEQLATTLERERGLLRTSLSQVMVIWQNAFRLSPELAAPPLGFVAMDQAWLAPEAAVTTFDVVFEVREGPLGLAGSCLYDTLLYDAPSVRRLLDDLLVVLRGITARPDQPLTVFRGLRGQDRGQGGLVE
jgi:non-ribosomal peptide synthetase component F